MRDLLKIKFPIIQAPMAGSDDAKFVAAASNAGVLGSLGAQYRTPDEITKVIAEIRALTDKPFAVNLFALNTLMEPVDSQIEECRSALDDAFEHFRITAPSNESIRNIIDPNAQLQAILEAKVPVISFTLGILDDEWIRAFKKNSVIIGTATNVKEARKLEAAGVDAITAQSSEAGGHRGTFIGAMENSLIGGFALIPQLVDAVNIPIIAAGGIMDGRGIAAALALGAAGVQMGTAFLTTAECPVHVKYKRAIRERDADDTIITKVFSGGAARGISNEFTSNNQLKPLLPFPFQNALTRPIRQMANVLGLIEFTNLWSGQSGRLAKELPISEFVEQLVAETNRTLSSMSGKQL